MPRATTGITANSVSKFLVDAGAVYLNYGTTGERVLGATRGGAGFDITQEIRSIEIDGSKGMTMGARRVTKVEAKIHAKLLELSTANIMLALAGSTSTATTETGSAPVAPAVATHDSITRTAEIAAANYVQNVALVGKIMGTNQNFVGIISNALADGGFKIETSDKGEAVLEIQFSAHFDPANMTNEPWIVRNPTLPA